MPAEHSFFFAELLPCPTQQTLFVTCTCFLSWHWLAQPRAELDAAAPKHPVVFSTGPDSMLNTLAMKENGIDKDYKPSGAGVVEKDPKTGEPTGLLRAVSIKSKSSSKPATSEQKLDRLMELFHDYNSVGLTCVADRNASSDAIAEYQQLKSAGRLSVRMMLSHDVNGVGRLETVQVYSCL